MPPLLIWSRKKDGVRSVKIVLCASASKKEISLVVLDLSKECLGAVATNLSPSGFSPFFQVNVYCARAAVGCSNSHRQNILSAL